MKEEIEICYKRRAEEYIDTLFDNGYFCKELKRKDMRDIEELLAFLFQSQCKSAIKGSEFVRKIRDINE